MKGFVKLFVIPAIIGVIGGFSAILMRELIKYSSFGALQFDVFGNKSNFYMIVVPILFLFSAFVIKKFMEDATNPTIDSVARSIILRKGRLNYKKGIASVVLTAINIGFGVPVGREGPIAKLGGSLTSFTLDHIKIEGSNIPLLVSCGVSSALAATFNAPIAAIIFGLEIILGRLSFDVIIPLSIASAVGTIISRYFLGNYPAFYLPKLSYTYILIVFIPVFSFLFALFVYSFETIYGFVSSVYEKFNLSFYTKALIGGFIVGLLLYFYPDAASLGYDKVGQLFSGKFNYESAIVLSIVKLIALAITFASGMFGGVFAPSIFGGAFFGFAIGGFFHQFIPAINPLSVALIGTAATTASISSAPFRSTLIVVELAQNYHMIVPLIIGSVMTMFFSHLLEEKMHFSRSVMQKGFDITNTNYAEQLKNLKIVNFIDTTLITLKKSDFVKDIIFDLMKSSSSYFAVLDDSKLVGVLSFRDIRLLGEFKSHNIRVEDVMTQNPSFLTIDSRGLDVFEFISRIDVDFIPVVISEDTLKYVGMLDVNGFLKYASFLYFKENLVDDSLSADNRKL